MIFRLLNPAKIWHSVYNHVTYAIAARKRPSHGEQVSAILWSLEMWFLRYACGQTERQADLLVAIFRSPADRGRINQANWVRISEACVQSLGPDASSWL